MHVMLVYPPLTIYGEDSTAPQIRPPLGLLYLAAVCERDGHIVTFLDCLAHCLDKREATPDGGTRYGLSQADIAQAVRDAAPDVVGVSAMFTAFSKDAHDIAQTVKSVQADTPIIVGGMHASTLPHEMLRDKNIDYLVLGEGEATFSALLRALENKEDVSSVAGIALRDGDGQPMLTTARERLKALDDLPLPARHLIDLHAYSAVAENEPDNYIMRHPYTTVSTSRGCVKRCVYCAAHNVWRNRFIPRSAENVLDEIEYLVTTYGIREVHFLDDNASLDRKRFMAICQGILDRGLDITWACPTGMAIWTLDEEVLQLMKRSGCYKICFGIESGDPDTQRFIRKKLDLDQAKKVITLASNMGFWLQSTFIIGFPYETREQILRTIDYAVESRNDFVNFLLLTPYPGTEVFNMMENEGLLPTHSWDYRNFGNMMSGFRTMCRTKTMDPNELSDLFDLAFRKLLRRRLARALRRPDIMLRKIHNLESLRFFFRIFFNFFGVAKVVFVKGVSRVGTLKPSYTSTFHEKS